MSESHPPTSPDTPVAPEGRDRLARLEKLVRYQWITMIILVVLVAGLVGAQVWMSVREASRSYAQLQLLQQIQQDFGQVEGMENLTQGDVYQQLRRSVNEVRRAYEPLKNFNLEDPDAQLDALLGDTRYRERPSQPEPATQGAR